MPVLVCSPSLITHHCGVNSGLSGGVTAAMLRFSDVACFCFCFILFNPYFACSSRSIDHRPLSSLVFAHHPVGTCSDGQTNTVIQQLCAPSLFLCSFLFLPGIISHLDRVAAINTGFLLIRSGFYFATTGWSSEIGIICDNSNNHINHVATVSNSLAQSQLEFPRYSPIAYQYVNKNSFI